MVILHDFTKGLTTLTAVFMNQAWIIETYPKMTPNAAEKCQVGYPGGAKIKIKSYFLDGNGWHVVDVDDTLTKYRGNGDDDDDDDILSDICSDILSDMSCGVLCRIHAGVSPADR